MWTTKIEGEDFTLFFDIDQLKDGKISRLSIDGKINWLKERSQMLLVQPITLAFTPDKAPTVKERFFINLAELFKVSLIVNEDKFNLTKIINDRQSNLVIGMFSLLMNGIEALGSFITVQEPRPGQNRRNFSIFIEHYMPSWNFMVSDVSLCSPDQMVTILWKNFRNGIAHAFIIDKGGLSFEADNRPQGYFITPDGYIQLGPRKFIRDFNEGLKLYFRDVQANVGGKKTLFLNRFNSTYPH